VLCDTFLPLHLVDYYFQNNSKVTAAVADTAQCLFANATAVSLAVTNWLIVVLYFLPQ